MAGTSGTFPAHATLAAAAAARPTEVACRLPTVASCKVRRSGGARGEGEGGGRTGGQVWRPGCSEYLSTWEPGRAGGRAAGQVARELPPSLKGGGSPSRSCSCSGPGVPVLSCAPVLLPFAASRVSWAAGPACGPTQSDEAACQHLGEGGSDPPSWSRLLFQVARTVSAARPFFCLVRIASYHVCLRGEDPILPYTPACKCCQGDGVMTATAQTRNHRIGAGNHTPASPLSPTAPPPLPLTSSSTNPLSCLQETRGSWEVGRGA